MGPAERRSEIMKILCRQRSEKIANLADHLDVSPRTIARDIEVLSLTEPIYTQSGKYGGGVYVMSEYIPERMYMDDKEIGVLRKLYTTADDSPASLTYEEKQTLASIIVMFSKPKIKQPKG